MMVTYDNEGYLIIAVSSLRARYLTHPIDFQDLTKEECSNYPKSFRKRGADLDIKGHEVVEDISTDWGGCAEETVRLSKTKFLFHLSRERSF